MKNEIQVNNTNDTARVVSDSASATLRWLVGKMEA